MARLEDFEFDVQPEEETVTTGYNANGQANIPPNQDDLAMKMEWKNRKRFFIRSNRANQFYNPWDVYSGRTNPAHSINDVKVWQYKEVSADTFDLYLRFLGTRNTAHLLQAQRLMV